MTRRTALRLTMLGGGAITTRLVGRRARAAEHAIVVPRFEQPLKVPPVLDPTVRTETHDEYDIVQREADQEILPRHNTKIWGYQGCFPGPTIRVRRNRAAVVRHTNRLPTHTVVHLHGGVTPAESDGFAMDMVTPGESRTHHYPNCQRACTLWYHDHAMDHTGENINRGLAGLYIIDDEEELALPLPQGPFDIPLFLQDRAFSPDGSFHYDTDGHRGFRGDVMLVNGVPWPKLDVSTRKYRFRIVNGSNARPFRLALSNGAPFTLIGTDGGLLAAPVPVKTLPLSMAERVEVIIDFSPYAPGEKVFLLNTREKPGLVQLMRFDITRREPDNAKVPSRLANPGFLERPKAANTRTWVFRADLAPREGLPPIVWTINGKRFDPDRSDAKIPLGEIELWRFRNEGTLLFLGRPHPAHVHLAHFQILERNGGQPLPHETGWKDTVALEKGEEVLVMLRFEQFRGRYMLHCHNLEHEDHAMMSRFDVI
jgi:spore coat protein A, manganese oxidase